MDTAELTFEGCMKRYGNFVEAHTRWAIPGFDRSDVRQEIVEVLLRCLQNYNPALNVPFYPYFKRAVINKLCKLSYRGGKRVHLFAERNPLPDDPDRIPAAPEPDPADMAASGEFLTRVRELSPETRGVIARILFGRPTTAVERRGARIELLDVLGEEVHAWRCAQRVPLDSRGLPARSIATAVGWRLASDIQGGVSNERLR